MRTVHTWKLRDLLHNLLSKKISSGAPEFDPDLLTKAMSFTDQMWNLRAFPNYSDSNTDLGAFTEMHPDFWMTHNSMNQESRFYRRPISCCRTATLVIVPNQMRRKMQ
jgi:hypothetical protein